ncbi:hypothetical protein MBLNU13_g01500t1 [Cladosporium sp. NU13]
MAARTPVTIESSPLDDAYHAPSVTPDSLRRSVSTNSITHFSSQLLSPSAFVRPRAQPLKSGSRAQQVPAGAQTGFASAASLLKEHSEAEDARAGYVSGAEVLAPPGNVQRSKGSDPTAKSAGKLTKPKKTPRTRKPSVTVDIGPESPHFDSFVEPKEGPSKSLPKTSRAPHVDPVRSPTEAITSRRPSINLSEYSFDGAPAPAQPPLPTKDGPAPKKVVRKRASKTANTGDAPVAKKSRKGKAKSEAIILDSDEPEETLTGAASADAGGMMVVTKPVAKKPRSRKTKQPEVSETIGEFAAVAAISNTNNVEVANDSNKLSTEKSAYFDQENSIVQPERLPSSPTPIVGESHHANAKLEPGGPSTTDLVADQSLVFAGPAPRRRRSWTPAKDTLSENTLPVVNQDMDATMKKVPFTELLGNFSYLQSEPTPVQRSVSGEASTKRRRIELSEHIGIARPQDPETSEEKSTSKSKAAPKAAKTAKKPKATAKKPQTVTALALAAYQPPKDPDPVQSTVSTYFTPQKDVEKLPPTESDAVDGTTVTKVKKSRKSRAKVPPADGDAARAKKPAKSRAKTTKVKVKFDKNDYQAPLYSPTQACKQMRSQDFIFGTSSQLAADESPEFVRNMQLALQQSEMSCALPNSSQAGTQVGPPAMDREKSCARVPTAPHGTCLSVEQAERNLWCVSARDSTGSKLAQEPSIPLPIMLSAADEEPIVRVIDIISLSSSAREGQGHVAIEPQPLPDPQANTMPSNTDELPQTLGDTHSTTSILLGNAEDAPPVAAGGEDPPAGEDWMFLGSDDSVLLPRATSLKLTEQPNELATSPARRTALQPLDANISMTVPNLTRTSTTKLQARSISTTTASPDRNRPTTQPAVVQLDSSPVIILSPKRGRGRPRKDSSLERPAQMSPTRGRGRPRKDSIDAKAAKKSPVRSRGRPREDAAVTRTGSVSPKRPAGRPAGRPRGKSTIARPTLQSPKRPVGRPRKDGKADHVSTPSPEEPQQTLKDNTVVSSSSISPKRPLSQASAAGVIPRALSPKRPVGRPPKSTATVALSPRAFRKSQNSPRSAVSQPVAGNEWTRIDEISDSDSPPTPSPRRRRASSSPAIVRPLDFDVPLSPSAAPKTAVPGNATIKATDACWPAIQTSIFPRIAETIKAAPLGNDMTTPSWHEKILLYDPIVLEDLTAWLNQQGLRIEIERLKPKTKTRGRKKKDAPPEIDEWETVKYELKAWMVQKWCEDNSVCCLWKEGLRGGVKARY